jgi:hypothetical protein
MIAHGQFLLCPMEIAPILSALSLWWLLWPSKKVKR